MLDWNECMNKIVARNRGKYLEERVKRRGSREAIPATT